ncbi:calcium-binding protein [Nocardioides sp. NPDC058538]|uniref:calcium-binding protein n=1 Tax=Nocardioides sp. NPDC058538 TaxID=3346542 RepID=UPI00366480CE
MVLLTGRTLLAGIVAMAASATVLVASPASAATTSTGVRCTIVGTSGADVLRGTSGRDVICGRGGSDVIYARSGNDLVDGGGGNDRIYGSYGTDKLLGGTGRDSIRGEAGADAVYGGSSSDYLYGGTSDDTIRGGSGNDQIQGDDGHDHIYGEADPDTINGGTGWDELYGGTGGDRILGGKGNDRAYGGDNADGLYGGAGNDQLHGGNHNDLVLGESDADRLWGDAGADQIRGGSGADQLAGGDGNDHLEGESNDDVLTGGAGTDQLTGGTGINRCSYDTYDYLLGGCGTDKAAPKVVSAAFVPSTVDTTAADAKVKLRLRASDDIGIDYIQAHVTIENNNFRDSIYISSMTRVSGGPRDGWYEHTVTVPRYTPAQTMHAQVSITDSAGRYGGGAYGKLTVTDSDPDMTPPTVAVTKLSPTSVNVTSAAKTVQVSVHATDAKSGIKEIGMCLLRPGASASDPYDSVACDESVARASGTTRDGIWTTTLTVPKGSPGGVYNLFVEAVDRVGHITEWLGPEAYHAYVDHGWCCSDWRELPGDLSRVDVTGPAQDTKPPTLMSVQLDKSTVRTATGADRIRVRARVTDPYTASGGIGQVDAELIASGSASDPSFQRVSLDLASGTVFDGWWEGYVVVPQGTSTGTYHLWIGLLDRGSNHVGFTDAAFADATGSYLGHADIPVIQVVGE